MIQALQERRAFLKPLFAGFNSFIAGLSAFFFHKTDPAIHFESVKNEKNEKHNLLNRFAIFLRLDGTGWLYNKRFY